MTRKVVRPPLATRHFAPRPVSAEQLRRVLEAARWTGSARNRQPWQFVAVQTAELRDELSRLGSFAGHLADAPVVVALASNATTGGADTEFDMGRACQVICTAAVAEGLASCPATLYPDVNATRAARLLGLAAPWLVRHAVALGTPAAPTTPAGVRVLPEGRLAFDHIVRWR